MRPRGLEFFHRTATNPDAGLKGFWPKCDALRPDGLATLPLNPRPRHGQTAHIPPPGQVRVLHKSHTHRPYGSLRCWRAGITCLLGSWCAWVYRHTRLCRRTRIRRGTGICFRTWIHRGTRLGSGTSCISIDLVLCTFLLLCPTLLFG